MIRKMRPEDRADYLSMAWDFYHSPAVLHPVPENHFTRAFDEMMRSETYMLGFIFELDGQTAGYAQLSKTFSTEAGGVVIWIEEIYVKPEFQGRGLGHELFQALPEIAPAARYRLEIEPDNTRAKKLYESMGFEELEYRQMVREEEQNKP